MKVILARTAGFCRGVRRAINMVIEEREQNSQEIYTDGPLIHNPQTIQILERRGVKIMGKEGSPRPGDTLVIRSHGIPPQRRQQLLGLGVRLCDATCPDVGKIQGLIRLHSRAGYTVVIVGDKGHAEVMGLAGYAGERGQVISSCEEVGSLPEADKVCVVVQSTLDFQTFEQISRAIQARYRDVLILDTICRSTMRRQQELHHLAQEADAVVVVGGKNSANTQHLAEISRNYGTPTFHVETADELDESRMRHFRTVAVTSGASTPNWILMEVVEKLWFIEYDSGLKLWRWARIAIQFLVRHSLVVALGAGMLCYANAVLMGIIVGWIPLAAAFSYILSVHLLTHFTDQGALELDKSTRMSFYAERGKLVLPLAAVSGVAALVLASLRGPGPFLVLFFLSLLVLVYRLDIFPASTPVIGKISVLRNIPGSKDLFMAFGWSVVTVYLPSLAGGHPIFTPAFALTFAFTFLLVIIRSLFFDLRDIQWDLIVGRETLPVIIGTRGTKLLIPVLTLLQALVLAAGVGYGWLTAAAYPLLLVTVYICLYLYLYHRRAIFRATTLEFIGDLQFGVAGLLALIYHFRLYQLF